MDPVRPGSGPGDVCGGPARGKLKGPRGLVKNPHDKCRYIRRTELHPLPEAVNGSSRVPMDIINDIGLWKQIRNENFSSYVIIC